MQRQASFMLTYSFENLGKMPLYEHLYRCIRRDIEAGVIAPGEKLPSKRALARHLGISTITVEGAYGQLMAEGYCTSQPKRGVYVAASLGRPQAFQVRASGGILGARASGAAVVAAQKSAASGDADGRGKEVPVSIDFAEGGANAENFPFAIWTKLLRQVVAEDAAALLARSPGQGVLRLREALVGHLRQFRGLSVSPEQIVVGAGTEYLYGLLVQLFGRDKRFCVENPGYGRIQRIYAACGAKCLLADIDAAGVPPAELVRQDAEILHISPSHHFPTGLIMPIQRRYELLAWAAGGAGRFIIEDDYDSEFRLTGRPIPTLMGIDAMGCVVYMNTFSKSLTPTIRISYMVLPKRLVASFREKLGFYSCTVSNFEQYTLARFIAEGHFEKHIHRMRTLYRKRRAAILSLLKKSAFAQKIEILEQGSGLHFLLRLKGAGTDAEIVEKLAAAGIRMKPLAAYDASVSKAGRVQSAREGVFVLDYSSVTEAQMAEAVRRIGQALYLA